jgi:endonuclease/exonuclease/phosphatase family metal-dependent hydrolase
MIFRILSLNAGLLTILGRSIPSPFVGERLAQLPDQIRNTGADVVLLQEVYGDAARRGIASVLLDLYPHGLYPRERRLLGLQNGVMTLSRFPASGRTILFHDAPLDESLLDSKGFLHSTHLLDDGLKLHILNAHTTAGGLFHHPENPRVNRIRSLQIRQMLCTQAGLPSPVVIAGDMNAGPGVSETNFRQVLDAGFVSIHDLVNGDSAQPTWDPLNPLNSRGPHRNCPPQRIDHVFVRAQDLDSALLEPISSRICLQDAVVSVNGNQRVSISDHYGIIVELSVRTVAGSVAASNPR